MKPCPTCGVRLADPLVYAIENPSREESCPQDIQRKMKSRRHSDEKQVPQVTAERLEELLGPMFDAPRAIFDDMEPPNV